MGYWKQLSGQRTASPEPLGESPGLVRTVPLLRFLPSCEGLYWPCPWWPRWCIYVCLAQFSFPLPPSRVDMEFGEPGVYSSAGVSGGQCLFAVCYQPLHHVWHLREQDQCMCMRTFVCLHAKSFTCRTVMNVALCSGVGCWNIGIRRRACRFGHFCVVAENDEQVSNLWPLSVVCVTGHVGIVYGLQAMEAPGQTKLFSASYDKTLRVCHP